MEAPHAATSWGAATLGGVSATLALLAGVLLVVNASDGRGTSRGDAVWAMAAATPEAATFALGVALTLAARRASSGSAGVGATTAIQVVPRGTPPPPIPPSVGATTHG